MRKLLSLIVFIILIGFIYVNRENIVKIYNQYFVPIENKITKLEKNNYYRKYDFAYVQNIDHFIPESKKEILNIYYTIVNSGMTDFTFYCPNNYKTCINDVRDIANDQETISNLNNFVHPYNSFKTLQTEVDSIGRVNIHINKVYDEEMIIILNYKIDEIIKNSLNTNDNLVDKIRKIHNYIINNTVYDKERSDNKIVNYKSDNAFGVLAEGYGLCGGYTDAMMLFLEKLGVKSIKISTENHIWNYVNLDNKWLHIDLTWDDPVSNDGKNILDDSYFLITDQELEQLEKEEHNYDHEIYAQ